MELDQKLTFQTKEYQYVASPLDADISDTVLLFEPRMSHPALRVKKENFIVRRCKYNNKNLNIDSIIKIISEELLAESEAESEAESRRQN